MSDKHLKTLYFYVQLYKSTNFDESKIVDYVRQTSEDFVFLCTTVYIDNTMYEKLF